MQRVNAIEQFPFRKLPERNRVSFAVPVVYLLYWLGKSPASAEILQAYASLVR